MTQTLMTPNEEYEHYARPENQLPQGPPQRRRGRLGDAIPVRFPPELVEEIRRRADADDRSVSSWIPRALKHELQRPARAAAAGSVVGDGPHRSTCPPVRHR